MSDNYNVILALAVSALVTSLGLALRQIYHCRSGCCESDCTKQQIIPTPRPSPAISPQLQKKSFITLDVPEYGTNN